MSRRSSRCSSELIRHDRTPAVPGSRPVRLPVFPSRFAAAGRRPACRRCGCRRARSRAGRCRAGRRAISPTSVRIATEWMAAYSRERLGGRLRRDDGDQLALVGDVQRIDAEDLAGAVRPPAAPAAPSPSSTTACRDASASSFSAVASPPRVGSRIQRRASPSSSSAAASSCTGAVSLSMSASSWRSPRAIITAMPWSPSVPETRTRSPGRTRSGPRSTPSGTTPTPAVLM